MLESIHLVSDFKVLSEDTLLFRKTLQVNRRYCSNFALFGKEQILRLVVMLVERLCCVEDITHAVCQIAHKRSRIFPLNG